MAKLSDRIVGDPRTVTANRNILFNSAFDIWQRGDGPFTSVDWTADRWRVNSSGGTADKGTFATGQTAVPDNPTFYLEAASGGSNLTIAQRFENVAEMAGETVTLSFWAEADNAGDTNAFIWRQFYGTGGSTTVDFVFTPTVSIAGTWSKHEITFEVPLTGAVTVGTGSYAELLMQPRFGNIGITGPIRFANMKMEKGLNATAFTTQGTSIGDELALCQRYYQTIVQPANVRVPVISSDATLRRVTIIHVVTMRATPMPTGTVNTGGVSLASNPETTDVIVTGAAAATPCSLVDFTADAEL